ncbi:NAD(P)-dependent oxidoreductase [Portibacter lacus]|uniref:Alanine dehydrogenase n=1 Tax=Portibacter lacus TaxID=1099794 RepID=A0AA37WEB2_9BACT|nr:NAD(P)-dependent oxidoreductase [Portibacter lacus]GLR15930.1 alanine dehydrogenase [Portibacter lacus]
MKIGVIREGKVPSDSRVCLTPRHCRILLDKGIDIVVQPSEVRVFKDDEYLAQGIKLQEDVSDRDILIGVKEVPLEMLIPEKTYFFFSHTFKEQVYNRGLLQEVLKQKIRLIDYEAITNKDGMRLIAFGKFAGIVGAHNGMYTYLKGKGMDKLPRMHSFFNYDEAKEYYKTLDLPKMKIVLTGTGRVAGGAAQVLNDMGIIKKSPLDFVAHDFKEAVYTQVNSFYYAKRKDGLVFDDVKDFYTNPGAYDSDFGHFLPMTDLFINGIYWDNRAPAFFTIEDMKSSDFRINTIADITCDIAPLSSIPSTIKASTIDDPIFGYDPVTEQETEPYEPGVVNMMTIDNLPNELPRDASDAFGDMFLEHVIPEMLKDESEMLFKASITTNDGYLNEPFEYLQQFVDGE